MATKKTTTKKKTRDAQPQIIRNYDPMSMEKRVFDIDHSPRRSWDLFALEERIHQLEVNGGGGGTSFPYYETDDGKIGLMVIDENNKFGVFYFKGVSISASGETISDERMTPYIPGGIPGQFGYNGAMCKGYDDVNNTNYVGDIAFMNDKLVMLSTSHAQYISGDVYGCMVVCGDRGGSENYMTQLTTYIPHT